MDSARVSERLLRLCGEEIPSKEEVKNILASHPEAIQYNNGEALLKACETVRADPTIDRNLIAYLLAKALERDELDQDDILRRCLRQLVRSSKVMVLRHLLSFNSDVILRTTRNIPTSTSNDLYSTNTGVITTAPHPSTTTASISSSLPWSSSVLNRGVVRKYSLTFVALKIDDDFDMISTVRFLLKVDPAAIRDERNGYLLIERVSAKHPARSPYHQLQLYRLFIDVGITHGIPKAGLIRNKFVVDDYNRLQNSPFHHLLILAPQARSCIHYLQNQTPPLLCSNDVTDYRLLYPAIKSLKIDLLQLLLDINVNAVKTTLPILLFPDLVDQCIQSPQKMEDWKQLLQILVEIGLQLHIGGEYGLGGLLVKFDDLDISIPVQLPGYYHHWSTPFLQPSAAAWEGAHEDDKSKLGLKSHREEEGHKGSCILQSLCLKLIDNNLNPYTFLSKLLFNDLFQRKRVPVLHSIIQSHLPCTSKIQFIPCFPWCVTFADSMGRLPIHHAIERGASRKEGVIQFLFEANPSTILVKDAKGRIPLYMIIHFVSQANEEAGEYFNILINIVKKEPWILSSVVDREYGLYPFMYAASITGAQKNKVVVTEQHQDKLVSTTGTISPLDICFVLLKASAGLLDRTNVPSCG